MSAASQGSAGTSFVVGMSGATGLAVVRSLGRAGVTCHALHFDEAAPGLASRLARPHVCPDWRSRPDEFVEWLSALAAVELQAGAASLFVSDDAAVPVVWEAREPLAKAGLRPAFAFAGSPLDVLDKRTQLAAAERAGVATPASRWGDAGAGTADLASWRYPVIVKPALSHLGVRRIGGKALRCATPDELAAALATTGDLPVVVQELVPGGDDQLYTCGVFRGAGAETLVFTGRKLKQHPPTLGIARLAEAVEVPELVEGSVALLDELGYQGVAQVEYKRDTRDGVYRLMEVNVRPWTWSGLAPACGIDLALAAHHWALASGDGEDASAGHGGQTPVLRQETGRWIWLLPEATHTLRDLGRGRLADVRLWRDLRVEAFFARDDPAPFWRQLGGPLRARRARLDDGWRAAKRTGRRLLRAPAFAVNLGFALTERRALRREPDRPRPAIGLPGGDRWLVLAPHPDDETILCGATMAAGRRRGDAVRIVSVTPGGATNVGVGDDVAAARRGELRRAAATLGVADVVAWDLPDRGLCDAREALAARIAAVLDEFRPTDVFAPFPCDPHPDHVAVGLALGDALADALAGAEPGAGQDVGAEAGAVQGVGATPRAGLQVHAGFVSLMPDPLLVGRVVRATWPDWRAKLAAVAAYASRDRAVFAKPLQLAWLAPESPLRPAEQFVELTGPAWVRLCAALEVQGLTTPATPIRSHPMYVLGEAAALWLQRRRLADVVAAARAPDD